MRLFASNFTFSAPTIRVKLSQEKASSPAPSPKAPTAAQKKYSIYCAKNGVKRELNGTKPQCPKGYKKVAK